MHPDAERFLLIAAIEDPDVPAVGQALHAAPEVIVVEILGGRRFEGMDLAALRIDAGHHMLDGAILAGGIQGLKDRQYRPFVLRVELVLQLSERLYAAGERLSGAGLVLRPKPQGVAGV